MNYTIIEKLCQYLYIGAMNIQSILISASEALDNGNAAEAERLFNLAIQKDGNCYLAYYNLALMAEENNDLAKASEHLEKALAIKNDDADILTAIGTVHLKSNRLDDAENFFLRALEIGGNEVAYNNLGIVHFQHKNYRKAKEFYKKALSINPDYQEARENIALANFYIAML